MKTFVLCICLLSLGCLVTRTNPRTGESPRDANWPIIGGDSDNSHYSPLAQINRDNVRRLEVAWSFDTEEKGGLETTPLIIDGVLYALTPTQQVFALDAATGKPIWRFNSGIVGTRPARAVAYWSGGDDRRIFAGVMNFVYGLDAQTGRPIPAFGKDGRIDLREDLGREPSIQSIALTSPPVIYKDLLIVGGATPETLPAPPGDVRAYDVRTGKLKWSFHTIPHPGEFGHETWPKDAWKFAGSANNWAGMTVDAARGIVYVPTGSAAPDWYGGDRAGDNLFSDTLLALDADTGKRIWHFQGVRHDLWDRDFPAPPSLLTVRRDGKDIPAIAQTTKQGFVFIFDRTNGNPLFPIEYRKVAASEVPGEVTAESQPFSTKPAPFAVQELTEANLTTRTPEAHAWAVEHLRQLISRGPFTPIGTGAETVIFPGADGGAEWGGVAIDLDTKVMYVNSNEFAHTESLRRQEGVSVKTVYQSQCEACHGQNREGAQSFPGLIDVQKKMTLEQITTILEKGKGKMPAYPAIRGEQRRALINYIITGEAPDERPGGNVTYASKGYHRFYDPDGYPANGFPWGTLNAINLQTGEYLWKIPFGEYPELAEQGLKDTGSENYGGPIVTAGGLLVIGATIFDNKVRIYDKDTGKLLWEKAMEYAVNATPATYSVNDRQYIVVAVGGEGRNPRAPKGGGIYVAFALPEK